MSSASPEKHNTIILIAGGSGSGKSTAARGLRDSLSNVAVVHFDDFQYDAKDLAIDEEGYRNWDDPSFTDFDFAFDSIKSLKENVEITLMAKNEYDNPAYIRGEYRRKKITTTPERICVVEGHYALLDPRIVDLADLTVFISVDPSVSISRRTKLSDKRYNEKYLRPMHEAYVAPTAAVADIMIDASDLGVLDVRDFISEKIKGIVND